MRIIKGSASHHPECVAIAHGLDQHFDEKARQKIPKDLEEQLLYVAVEDDEVLAFITIERRSEHVGEITWLGVRKEHWRNGIGTALVAQAEHYLASDGVTILEVKTLADTVEYEPYERTRAFYHSVGFVYLETVLEWDPGNPCAIYVKALQNR